MNNATVDVYELYKMASACPAEELIQKIANLKKELEIYEMVKADRVKLGETGLGSPKREVKSKTAKQDSKTDANKVKQEVKSNPAPNTKKVSEQATPTPTPQVKNSAQPYVQSQNPNANYQGQGYAQNTQIGNLQY